MNAREEFLEHISGNRVKCAEIGIAFGFNDNIEDCDIICSLPVGYSDDHFSGFLNDLNVEYDSGYGTRHLFGTIWYEDGTWSEREEYDGSEWWSNRVAPDVPSYLLNR